MAHPMKTDLATEGLTRRTAMRAGALGLAALVAGCGKRGPLEPADSGDDKPQGQPDPSGDGVVPNFKGARRRAEPIKRPERDFFLDFLL